VNIDVSRGLKLVRPCVLFTIVVVQAESILKVLINELVLQDFADDTLSKDSSCTFHTPPGDFLLSSAMSSVTLDEALFLALDLKSSGCAIKHFARV
jgi:hypothetical protein